ncbi:MAG: hypothetical protein WC819_05625 [Parcubacteria group bacterium]|jgi:hypothetical protein
MVIAAASVLFAGTIQLVVAHVKYNTTLESDQQAFHIAEAGIFFYRWYLAHNIEGKTASQIQDFWDGDPLGQDDNGDGDCDDPDTADGDGDGTEAYVANYEGIGQYKICITPPQTYSTVLHIQSEGTATSSGITKTRTIRARQRKPSWSEFAILANADTRLSEGTVVYGPMHVNGGFRFDGVAYNIVTSSKTTYQDPDTGITRPGVWTNWTDEYNITLHKKVFQAGKRFPVSVQDFNSVTANFDEMRELAIVDNTYFDNSYQGRYIELKVDGSDPTKGTMELRRVQSFDSNYTPTFVESCHQEWVCLRYKWNGTCRTWGWDDVCAPEDPIIKNLDAEETAIVYVRDNVWIEGKLPEGMKLTIAAHDEDSVQPRMFIGMDDIEYEDRDSDCVLGLAAEGNIELVRNSEGLHSVSNSDERYELKIDAVLLSQYGRIGRDNWNDCKDTITLYGAIATNTRMNFGYVGTAWCDGANRPLGFETRNLYFDGNLLYSPPPMFPTGSTYAMDLWEEIK